MKHITLLPEVEDAINNEVPVVALESTVITHGLPRPFNVETAQDIENAVRKNGAVPATIAVIKGEIHVGLSEEQLIHIGNVEGSVKISRRNFAGAILKSQTGGTTVSGTMTVANRVGIKCFATGGIGGVHRENPMDMSADLPALKDIPMVVVCAGAKSILDLPLTLEVLETYGVPVVGYQTDYLPAFYAMSSGLPIDYRLDTTAEIAEFANNQWQLQLPAAVLVTVPPPENDALDSSFIETKINEALKSAEEQKVTGAAITPFLLSMIANETGDKSLKVNRSLLIKNAEIAAEIANSLSSL